jgi:iron complex outermembrane recepter protein
VTAGTACVDTGRRFWARVGGCKPGRSLGRCAQLALALLFASLACGRDLERRYDINIPAQRADIALKSLARQAESQLLFSYDGARAVQSNPVSGRYTLSEALEQMLRGTGLSSGLTKSGVITVTPVAMEPHGAEQDVNTKKKLTLLGGIAAIFGLGATPHLVLAGEESRATTLEEVVVTAQRREERLQDVPLTVVALSSGQLDKAGVTNIFDLQSVVSGLTYSGVGNSTQPAIRGLSTMVSTNGSENPNALYVDGVYYATNQLLGANLPDVERVEVLKGPQGTLFGRNSVGGAIRIFTKDPTFAPSGDITVDGGYYTGDSTSRSNPHGAVRGFVSIPLVDNRLAWSLSGGYDTTNGFMTNEATGEKYGKIERTNARTKLLWKPTDGIRAVINAYYLKHDDEGLQSATPLNGLVIANTVVPNSNPPILLYPGSIVPIQPYHTGYDSGLGVDINVATVRNYGFGANLQFDIANAGVLTSITDWNDNDVVNLTTFTHSKDGPSCIATFKCVDYSYFFHLKAFSEELNFVSRKSGMFSTTAGLFYYHQDSTTAANLQATIVPGGLPLKSELFKIDSSAIYAEVDIQPTDPLTFIVGGRYTHESHDDTNTTLPGGRQVTFEGFVPRLTVKYAFTPALNAYATYSEGEKAGLSGIANTASVPQYLPVEPEKNDAYEVGMKYATPDFALNLSAFYYDYKNKQEQGFTGTAVFLFNSGPVRIEGMDLDTSFRLSHDFILRGNASWVPEAKYLDFPHAAGYGLVRNPDGSFKQLDQSATGLRLVKAPEFTGNASLDFAHATGSGSVDASMNISYSSTVYHDIFHVMKQSPYTTLNARAGYTFGDSRTHLSLYGRNLTNETYIANGFSSGQGFTAAYVRPREIGLSLSYSY